MDEQIIRTEYSEVMQKSYIDYAMSVIVARALPDVRDGLKPVQRRTLYDMYELGIRHDRPYRKSARIVGDTMGKYHPHGDASIYDSLVVMSQEFKKGLPLIDGHGNFGSIEGDGAAAMRYTEARLEKVSQEMFLQDLDKNIVDFIPNFDATEKEPEVLPARLPNLLLNGAEGIAVGMATSIPPHNFSEVIDSMKAYMTNPDITVEELMNYIKGPDFPTGGIVVNQADLLRIYETGMGKIRIRGKVEVETLKGGKERLIISEIPYTMIGANIGKFLNDVFALVETKKTADIVDISNQSSKEGIRIVIDLRKGADANALCNLLYKKTRLEDTFGVNMLAVANGKPETLSLKQILEHHTKFHYELSRRKYTTLLAKELEKKEIQEGLIKACDVIDLIIEILRGSKQIKDVKDCLINGNTGLIKFKSKASEKIAANLRFTEKQATAILEMRLYRLIGLEIEALMKEHEITLKNINTYEELLNNKKSMTKLIIKELNSFQKEYSTQRRTKLENAEEVVLEEKPMEAVKVVFVMDRFGYTKTLEFSNYERNKETVEKENRFIIPCMNIDRICLFTNTGNMHSVKVLDVPMGKLRDKGTPIDNISNYNSNLEEIVRIYSLQELKEPRNLLGTKLLFATELGMVKLVDGSEFDVSKRTVAATKLQEEDQVVQIQIVDLEASIVLQTQKDIFLRFKSNSIPEKKKSAIGVRGIKLEPSDKVTEVYLLNEAEEKFVEVKESQVALHRLRVGSRDTKGVKR